MNSITVQFTKLHRKKCYFLSTATTDTMKDITEEQIHHMSMIPTTTTPTAETVNLI